MSCFQNSLWFLRLATTLHLRTVYMTSVISLHPTWQGSEAQGCGPMGSAILNQVCDKQTQVKLLVPVVDFTSNLLPLEAADITWRFIPKDSSKPSCSKQLNHVQTFFDLIDCYPPGSSAHGFSRQEYRSGQPFPLPGDLPDPGIEPRSPVLQLDYLLSNSPGKPTIYYF